MKWQKENSAMNLKYDENNNPEVLNSDIEQSLSDTERKLKLAIDALKDIMIWCEDLDQAKGTARYILAQLGY